VGQHEAAFKGDDSRRTRPAHHGGRPSRLSHQHLQVGHARAHAAGQHRRRAAGRSPCPSSSSHTAAENARGIPETSPTSTEVVAERSPSLDGPDQPPRNSRGATSLAFSAPSRTKREGPLDPERTNNVATRRSRSRVRRRRRKPLGRDGLAGGKAGGASSSRAPRRRDW